MQKTVDKRKICDKMGYNQMQRRRRVRHTPARSEMGSVQAHRHRQADSHLPAARDERDGFARYSGHKRRKMRKQGGTVE